jgi:glycosyltransferase involved in cell wall biosynthesis
MRILMVTNTYAPHVGGVANSIVRFERCFRERGHRVLVIAPTFDETPKHEEHVVRLASIRHINNSDFSLALGIPEMVGDQVEKFKPEIVHSHHPYLLGVGALRIAAARSIPVVFTHHTLYEHYTHYVGGDSDALKRFVIALSSGYANLCDEVIAPSKSVKRLIRGRGVRTPISVIPTGVDVQRFRRGDGGPLRRKLGVPADAFVVGHVGRLAEEKNLRFLTESVGRFLRGREKAHFVAVGHGNMVEEMRAAFKRLGVADRVHFAGSLQGEDLINAYHALNLFAFASKSETQGMVIAEAMSAGLPVVALNAPAVEDIVKDRYNGRAVSEEDPDAFAAALGWTADLAGSERKRLLKNAGATAREFSESRCAAKALRLYRRTLRRKRRKEGKSPDNGMWAQFTRSLEEEWKVWGVRLAALAEAAMGH